MSVGFGFSLPALAQYGGGGNNPFGQLGPTLDLSFAGTVTDTGDPNGYTLNTNFIAPQYQVAADYTIWETNVGLVSKTFSQIITFTRASSATFTGSNGLIQSAAIDAPRFDYDPVTLAAKGLLIEEQRTNLLTYSEDFSNAAWQKVDVTISANSAVAPDGATTADKMIESTAAGVSHYVNQLLGTIGALETLTVYAKPAGRNWVYLQIGSFGNSAYFDVQNGTVGTVSGAGATASIENVGNGWFRCRYTQTRVGSSVNIFAPATSNGGLSYTGDGTSGLFIWGAQLEAGAFPTSYIPTVASQVTRSADVASVNTLSPWYNATEGTFYASFQTLQTGTFAATAYVILLDANPNKRIAYIPAGSQSITTFDGTTIIAAVGDVTGSISNIASAYNAVQRAIVANGSSVNTGSVVAGYSTASNVTIASANSLNGHIRRITYYPRRLSNAELQAITA